MENIKTETVDAVILFGIGVMSKLTKASWEHDPQASIFYKHSDDRTLAAKICEPQNMLELSSTSLPLHLSEYAWEQRHGGLLPV